MSDQVTPRWVKKLLPILKSGFLAWLVGMAFMTAFVMYKEWQRDAADTVDVVAQSKSFEEKDNENRRKLNAAKGILTLAEWEDVLNVHGSGSPTLSEVHMYLGTPDDTREHNGGDDAVYFYNDKVRSSATGNLQNLSITIHRAVVKSLSTY